MYATRSGTLRNVALLKQGGWRFLYTPYTDLSPTEFSYGLDNGEWTSSQQGLPFDVPLFEKAVARVGAGADWIVAPDIYAGGLASLAFSETWIPRLKEVNGLVLIVIQDGMRPHDLIRAFRRHRPGVGFFLGGTTAFKERTMRMWGRLARRLGVYYHVGRVNTARRLALAVAAGANSVDGTSASKFAVTIPMLTYAARQQDLFAVRKTR